MPCELYAGIPILMQSLICALVACASLMFLCTFWGYMALYGCLRFLGMIRIYNFVKSQRLSNRISLKNR